MNAVNRFFVAILALAWIALLGFIAYLVWNPGEFIEASGSAIDARFEMLLDTTAEQTLASIVIGLLMLPAVMLLFMEATVRDRRAHELDAEVKTERDRNKRLEARIKELEKDLGSERKHDADTRVRVADREERLETSDNDRVRVADREERVETYDNDRVRVADREERVETYDNDRVRPTASRRWHLFGR